MINLDLTNISNDIPAYIKDFDFSYIDRYKIIATLIEKASTGQKSIKILDVGGYNGPIQKFFPKAVVTILDVVDSDEKNYVKASGANMPFENNEFDIVISSDTLEHIPANERQKFISEILRVSKKYIFLGAPFGSQRVVDAEEIADGFYVSMTGKSYIWLKEHRQFGLPKKDWLNNYLSKQDVYHTSFDHTSIDAWTLMICGSFFLAGNIGAVQPDLGAKLRKGNDNYLKDIAYRDFPEEGYRTFFVISKMEPVKVSLPTYSKEAVKKFINIEVATIGRIIQEFSNKFGIAEHQLGKLNDQIHHLNQKNIGLQSELNNIRSSRAYKLAVKLSKTKQKISRNGAGLS